MTLAHQHNEPHRRQTLRTVMFVIKTEFSESFGNFSPYLSVVFKFSEVLGDRGLLRVVASPR